ncbi:LysE family translocator [Halalkalirubrum salinum]|uniref:LysE family translocator n=1 Tax=Halalkalirubrum salinum TaxID=2563889 RepID=UPI002AA2A9F6|nr:LysE family translocator [Halalkalirubrum salinum]
MLEPAVLVSFVPAVLAIVATPGPDSIYTLTQSLREGRTAGVVAGAGTATGVLVHTAAAVVGLAALLRATPDAYLVVTYVGAAYLVYLGVQLIRAEGTFELRDSIADETRSLARSYRQAVMINVSNPQVALFVLAFFPQFVPPAANAPAQLSPSRGSVCRCQPPVPRRRRNLCGPCPTFLARIRSLTSGDPVSQRRCADRLWSPTCGIGDRDRVIARRFQAPAACGVRAYIFGEVLQTPL